MYTCIQNLKENWIAGTIMTRKKTIKYYFGIFKKEVRWGGPKGVTIPILLEEEAWHFSSYYLMDMTRSGPRWVSATFVATVTEILFLGELKELEEWEP